MPILMSCSECGFTAEVADHLTLNAAHGAVDYLALRCTAGHHQTMEHASSRGRIDPVLKGVHDDIVRFGNTSAVRYKEMCLAIFGRLNSLWTRTIGALSACARWCSIGAATVALVLLTVMPATGRQGASADSGISACRALSGAHHVAAADYPRIRAQFASSRRPDLQAAGTAYLDLLAKLRNAIAGSGYYLIQAWAAEWHRPTRRQAPARALATAVTTEGETRHATHRVGPPASTTSTSTCRHR